MHRILKNRCPAFLLEQIELQIAKVKEEAFSRNEVLEKYEKWLAACEEESWLEEYNMVRFFFIFFHCHCICIPCFIYVD